MPQNYEMMPSPLEYAQQVLRESDFVLQAAVGTVLSPEAADRDPLHVFPAPANLRDESNTPKLTQAQKDDLAAYAGELGFGRQEDITLSEQGYNGAVVVVEGGQPHKMYAELEVVAEDAAARPKMIVMTATPHRHITKQDERDSAEHLLHTVGETEYDVARDVARAFANRGFVAYDSDRRQALSGGYDIHNGFSYTDERTGQFEAIGELNGAMVVLMRIDRDDLPGGRYQNQPANADVLAIVDQFVRARGDAESPIVQVTSGTYAPSRRVGVALAGLTLNRQVGIAVYGNARLNDVRGGKPRPAPLDQLPSELYVMAEQANRLHAEIYRLQTAQPYVEQHEDHSPRGFGNAVRRLLSLVGIRL